MKKALITGITGQDGSYLADFLLTKDYVVHGMRRRSSSYNLENIDHLNLDPHEQDNRFLLHYGDMNDASSLSRLIEAIQPDEIYNLAAQSHVHISFQIPENTAEVSAIGTLRLLDAIKEGGYDTRFYQASSSELFGAALETPQNEKTPFNPQSPYAVAKLYAYWITKNYRAAYGLHASNGILFNHESPRRSLSFLTRKVTSGVAEILAGTLDRLHLGNLEATRDWGYAPDYVEAMWAMLQQEEPLDLVIATGETHSVREFVELAFRHVDIELDWTGEGLDEQGLDRETGRVLVAIDPYFFRPTEVDSLLGDPSKATESLGWKPRTGFRELVEIMMRADLEKFAGL